MCVFVYLGLMIGHARMAQAADYDMIEFLPEDERQRLLQKDREEYEASVDITDVGTEPMEPVDSIGEVTISTATPYVPIEVNIPPPYPMTSHSMVVSGYSTVDTGKGARKRQTEVAMWDGCRGKVRGSRLIGKTPRCETFPLEKNFQKHLDRHLFACSKKALKQAGEVLKKLTNGRRNGFLVPDRMELVTFGTYSNRDIKGKSGKLSLHASARAIDIRGFRFFRDDIKDNNGNPKPLNFSMHLNKIPSRPKLLVNKAFYNGFRQCWKDALPSSCGHRCASVGSPYSGSKELQCHNDHNHEDHLHIEYPHCVGF